MGLYGLHGWYPEYKPNNPVTFNSYWYGVSTFKLVTPRLYLYII